MKILPIRETGSGREGTLDNISYAEIVEKIGKPNVTDMDDPDKVKASWGFKVGKKKGFIWCYKHYGALKNCKTWSTDGDESLLKEIFGDKYLTDAEYSKKLFG